MKSKTSKHILLFIKLAVLLVLAFHVWHAHGYFKGIENRVDLLESRS